MANTALNTNMVDEQFINDRIGAEYYDNDLEEAFTIIGFDYDTESFVVDYDGESDVKIPLQEYHDEMGYRFEYL